ncbi:MAG: hypothetical protein A2V66_11895 [Ignavibacteria bacterium RBG_13_36_8]|nr:MAG: hypothetical protein A2V66_11895 [Ignavibacteria bacterium RBG_13_36_8]
MLYIDNLKNYGFIYRGKLIYSCHLFSDNFQELTIIAEVLKLKQNWIHKSRLSIPHFDLIESKQKLALKLGAVKLTKENYLKVMTKLKKIYWNNTQQKEKGT